MRRRFSIPPISAREARISILFTVLFGYFGRQILLTTMLTWRGWSLKPARFWRPFTVVSLLIAAVAALFWPALGGDALYEKVFGASFFAPTPPHTVAQIGPVVYVMLCYIVWSLALLPHTLVRVGTLLYHHRKKR
jgi:hypothetical protein